MANDNKSHYLIYRVLGISFEEGENIDLYQNKGRFFIQICWFIFRRSCSTIL